MRPKRQKCEPKARVCIFSLCEFCKRKTTDKLHLIQSDNVGEKLLSIKKLTKDDHVRTSVSDLYEVGDASAKEKYYHDHCMLYAQRTCTFRVGNQQKLLTAICDEELLVYVQNTLIDGSSLNMAQVNDAYEDIVRQYHGDIEPKNWRKYLKTLISDNLPHVQFVKSKQLNMPAKLVISETVTEAIELLSIDSTDGILKNVATMLREEIMDPKYRNWSFKGRFDDFNYPPIMQFF